MLPDEKRDDSPVLPAPWPESDEVINKVTVEFQPVNSVWSAPLPIAPPPKPPAVLSSWQLSKRVLDALDCNLRTVTTLQINMRPGEAAQLNLTLLITEPVGNALVEALVQMSLVPKEGTPLSAEILDRLKT